MLEERWTCTENSDGQLVLRINRADGLWGGKRLFPILENRSDEISPRIGLHLVC